MSVKLHLAVFQGNLPNFWVAYGTRAYACVVFLLGVTVSIGHYTYRH